ncbi:serine hydrolase [Streptomyces sp. NK08204]|uniref:serine hydrolase n=1 Tax=Streptomyces sp. NK08204 TaxID=2873260 RepID=UPI001CECDDD5
MTGSGGETGVQLAAWLDGELVVDAGRGRPMGSDALVPAWSTGKGVAAALAAVLVDRGVPAYEAPVARYWPRSGRAEVLIHVPEHLASRVATRYDGGHLRRRRPGCAAATDAAQGAVLRLRSAQDAPCCRAGQPPRRPGHGTAGQRHHGRTRAARMYAAPARGAGPRRRPAAPARGGGPRRRTARRAAAVGDDLEGGGHRVGRAGWTRCWAHRGPWVTASGWGTAHPNRRAPRAASATAGPALARPAPTR